MALDRENPWSGPFVLVFVGTKRAPGRDTNKPAPFKIIGKLVVTGQFSARLQA
jgi:hypothetical protein